jgi:GxxExxY protein
MDERRRSSAPTGLSEDVERLATRVIGAALEVHSELGPGFIENVYEEALCVELEMRSVPFVRQAPVALNYKGRLVGEGRLDLLVGDILIVELKAVEALTSVHTAQVISYLKITGLQLALLINFNVASLRQGIRRIILSKH